MDRNEAERAEILFREFLNIHTAFLFDTLVMCDKEQGQNILKAWDGKFAESGNKAFNDIAAAMYEREDEILNSFVNRSINAAAESLMLKSNILEPNYAVSLNERNFLTLDDLNQLWNMDLTAHHPSMSVTCDFVMFYVYSHGMFLIDKIPL